MIRIVISSPTLFREHNKQYDISCLQINSELKEAMIYIFCLLTVGNRRLNTCIVLSKVTALPLKIPYYQLHNKSKPILFYSILFYSIPNLFEGTVSLCLYHSSYYLKQINYEHVMFN
jgi:hypothetical protein